MSLSLRALTLMLVLLSTNAIAQDFETGLAAYEAGDYKAALREWEPLAIEGSARAQYHLALMYAQAQGVERDWAEAARLNLLAAEQGLVEAQFFMGFLYATGNGVPEDDAEAVRWYRNLAKSGYAMGQWALGDQYRKGEGVPKDYVIAYMWFNLAAAAGLDEARAAREKIAKEMLKEDISEAQKRSSRCSVTAYLIC